MWYHIEILINKHWVKKKKKKSEIIVPGVAANMLLEKSIPWNSTWKLQVNLKKILNRIHRYTASLSQLPCFFIIVIIIIIISIIIIIIIFSFCAPKYVNKLTWLCFSLFSREDFFACGSETKPAHLTEPFWVCGLALFHEKTLLVIKWVSCFPLKRFCGKGVVFKNMKTFDAWNH